MAQRPEFLTQHTITHEAMKIKNHRRRTTQWESYEREPIQGTYIGYRFKFNGHMEADGDPQYGYVSNAEWFVQSGAVEVWMFVTNVRQNPIAVFPFEFEDKDKS